MSTRTFSKPMYGNRPCCLVQAITRHTCPDPHLGSWNCLPHQDRIAPSEPMNSIEQQGSSLGSFPTFPSPFIRTLISLRAFDLMSSPVWWEAATNKQKVIFLQAALTVEQNSLAGNPFICICCITVLSYCPVGWGCRIHQLYLCSGVRPLQWVSWIWH